MNLSLLRLLHQQANSLPLSHQGSPHSSLEQGENTLFPTAPVTLGHDIYTADIAAACALCADVRTKRDNANHNADCSPELTRQLCQADFSKEGRTWSLVLLGESVYFCSDLWLLQILGLAMLLSSCVNLESDPLVSKSGTLMTQSSYDSFSTYMIKTRAREPEPLFRTPGATWGRNHVGSDTCTTEHLTPK